MFTVEICDLEIMARIGAFEEERREFQRLLVSVSFPVPDPKGDDLCDTVDYAAVAEALRACAKAGERKLLETLCAEIVQEIRLRFGVEPDCVMIKKFILPETRWVAVHWSSSTRMGGVR